MLLPTLFVGLCVLTWPIAGPTHKTKSGEVPTPGKIFGAYSDNKRIETLKTEFKTQKDACKEQMTALAEAILAGTSTREDRAATLAEREEMKVLKAKLDDIRSIPPKKLKESQLAANAKSRSCRTRYQSLLHPSVIVSRVIGLIHDLQ